MEFPNVLNTFFRDDYFLVMNPDASDFEGLLKLMDVVLKFGCGRDCEIIIVILSTMANGWIRIIFGFSLNHFSTAFLNFRSLLINSDFASKYSLYKLIIFTVHLFHVLTGLGYGFFAWKTNGIEVSSAIHTANNFAVGLFIMLGLTVSDSSQLFDTAATVVFLIVLYIIMYYVGKKN